MARFEELIWQGSPTGQSRRERTSCSYRAYLPDPLAERVLALPADLVADLSDAERAVSALQDRTTGLASVESVARLLLRAEAVGSSYIEGLQVNARRLAKEEFAERAGLPTDDDTARAVLGNIRAMGGALELADLKRPITTEDLCALHQELLVGTRDEHWGGVVRQEQNWIGGINPVAPPTSHRPMSWCPLCSRICARTYRPTTIRPSSRPPWPTPSSRRSTPSSTGTGGSVGP